MKRLLWKLYSATVLILVLPLVIIESIVRGKPVKGELKKWCAYWPANVWGKDV